MRSGVGGGVVNNALFQKHFGMWDGEVKDKKKIDSISSIVVSVLQAGAFFGALGSSFISRMLFRLPLLQFLTSPAAKIGRRYTLFTFAALFLVGAILTTVAKSPSNGLALIYAGRVISGVGIGGISAVAPAYVSEAAPKDIRGRVTGLFQIMVATGVMLSYFINCSSPHLLSLVPRSTFYRRYRYPRHRPQPCRQSLANSIRLPTGSCGYHDPRTLYRQGMLCFHASTAQ